jgi:hypothetical protein
MTTNDLILRGIIVVVAGVLVYFGVSQDQVIALVMGLLGVLGLGSWSTVQEIKANRVVKQMRLEKEGKDSDTHG